MLGMQSWHEFVSLEPVPPFGGGPFLILWNESQLEQFQLPDLFKNLEVL